MKTHYFMIASRSAGNTVEITARQFDDLVAARAQWDLFVAIKGDAVWASGGEMPEAEREVSRGHRLARSHVVPIVNLVRSRRSLTPSQAARMTSPTAIPAPIDDADGEERYRKALEKGRRAVDRTVGASSRPAIWRAIETGSKQPNGERLYRFRFDARRDDGESLNYCVLWCEAIPAGVRFHPDGDAAKGLPICDGGYGVRQRAVGGLKVTVRDCVINGPTDELVFLVDLVNEGEGAPLVISRAVAGLAGVGCSRESSAAGPRIRAERADVVRLPAFVQGHAIGQMVPGIAAHFRCLAFSLVEVWPELDDRVFDSARLVFEFGGQLGCVVDVGVRVHGEAALGHLERVGAGWRLKPGYAATCRRVNDQKLAALLANMSRAGGGQKSP